jgi:hypothetical protein
MFAVFGAALAPVGFPVALRGNLTEMTGILKGYVTLEVESTASRKKETSLYAIVELDKPFQQYLEKDPAFISMMVVHVSGIEALKE